MSQSLKDHIAAAVVLICDARQEPDNVHKLIESLCDQAHNEGYMAGLDRAQALFNKHFGMAIV